MKISIALAVYNGTNYLSEQLESYLWQTKVPNELVAVDDCSTDKTVKLLEDFAAQAPFPVRIFSNEKNSGATASFDRAFSNCSGDLIFPSDHDDVWLPEKLERMSREFEKSPELGLLQANAEVVDKWLRSLGWLVFEKSFPPEKQAKVRRGKLFEVQLDRNVVGGATCAFRAKYRRFFLPTPAHIGLLYDGWFGLIISAMAKTDFLTEPLMRYRQHTGQQVGTEGKNEIQEVLHRNAMALDAQRIYENKISHLKFVIETLSEIYLSESANTFLPKAISVAQEEILKATEALGHFRVRSELGQARAMRIPTVLAEGLAGRYHKFSNGFKSMARDLIER